MVFANHNEEGHSVKTAKVREGSSSVARTRADEASATVVMHALNGRNGFHVFETARWTYPAFFGPVAVEGDPEIGKTHRLAEGLRFVRHRASNVVVGFGRWNP